MYSHTLVSLVILAMIGAGMASAQTAPPEKEVVLDLGGGTSMKFVLIPAGRFTRGSPNTEAGRQDNEGPQRVVTISQPFYMAVHEVTYRQYEAVMGKLHRQVEDPDLPVSGISWNSATEFCERLSKLRDRTISLPTEDQWEYACRAGSRTRYSFGDDDRLLSQYARYGQQGNAGPLRAASLKPNAWGLYDMHGNLAELCADFYKREYPAEPETDPTGRRGEIVHRGGAWAMNAPYCRSASRGGVGPQAMSVDIGFRVAMTVSAKPAGNAGTKEATGETLPGTPGAKEAIAGPPFIDARAIKERFNTITPKDIEQLRGLRILVASKSLGLNLMKGFGLLAKEDPAWTLSVRRYDVEKKGGLEVVPADAFKEPGIVHIMATRYPLHQRVQEVDDLLRKAPWKFADKVDAVVIIYSAVKPETFAEYSRIMDKLRADFPKVCLIHTTTGLNAEGAKKESNQEMHAFSELMRKAYRGKAPVYDLGAILSQDFRLGQVMVPEYTQDPTGVHPNQDAGELAMAKGLALALRDGLLWQGRTKPGQAPPETPAQGPTKAPAVQAETLPADHPEYRAARTILDHNGLKDVRVEGQIEVRGGHVVGLYIQEAGVTEIPAAIGDLPHLERLHCYADRTLKHPFLKSISPAIGRCTELQGVLINGNDLTTLPAEIAGLKKVKVLSVAENCLRDLPSSVANWVRQLDPKGLEHQRKP